MTCTLIYPNNIDQEERGAAFQQLLSQFILFASRAFQLFSQKNGTNIQEILSEATKNNNYLFYKCWGWNVAGLSHNPLEEQDYIIIVWTARECHFSVYFVRISLSQLPIYISFMLTKLQSVG